MAFFGSDIETLDDLFVGKLRVMYYAEHEIADALPQLAEQATNPELKAGFQQHLAETQAQIRRLEQVFDLHGERAEQVDCPAIDGILKAGDSVADDTADGELRDAALIASAQLVEHYEIAQYGSLIAWARELGKADCADLLEASLAEEKATDEKLTGLAETRLNRQARSSHAPA